LMIISHRSAIITKPGLMPRILFPGAPGVTGDNVFRRGKNMLQWQTSEIIHLGKANA
jgi:hypothetical protein